MSKIALIMLPLALMLGSCSAIGFDSKSNTCPVEDKAFCKQRESFLLRQNLFVRVMDKYRDCMRSVSDYRITQVCGSYPQWKDFKPN